MINYTSHDVQRFWNKVQLPDQIGTNECWLWIAGTNKNGYGRISINNVAVLANRFSWIIAIGQVPYDLDVLHKCDNPRCVNPSHLWLGTQIDNNADMFTKGRVQRGASHYRSVLNDDQVREIVKLLKDGQMLQREIAVRFGVKREAISKIKNGARWKHITKIEGIDK